jgi:phosphate transport system permease protein
MTMNSKKNHRDILQETVDKKYRKRMFVNKLVTISTIVCVIAAIVPLTSILIEVVKNGISAISYDFLTQPQGSIGSGTGGIAPAIQGTFIVVGLAAAIGTPVGLLTGIYLSEFAKEGYISQNLPKKGDFQMRLDSLMMSLPDCHR